MSSVEPTNQANGFNPGDSGDAWGKPFFSDVELKARAPVGRNAAFYNMNHKNRGVALIFNHENFKMGTLRSRTGTTADRENLSSCLKELGFTVTIYNDLAQKQIMTIVNEVAASDHSDNDCFLMAVLSHGEMGVVYARDTAYKPNALWQKFTSDNAPTLAGKPKIFIFQACQGDRLDQGIKLVTTQVDNEVSYKIPLHADFLIAYSTVPGFYSWRNTTHGSWFIQTLCAELRANGLVFDILTLLTFVCQRVALDFESNSPAEPRMHRQKQIPCVTTMLTRLLKFTGKESMV
ncbi:caspase-1 isoform X2 [Bacillus rossius redtenbacheri]|uniref:caspase-1 isoform X2 n=1 Tax=Bacillus rossius redtenbacheri TaxID=93214 RepID=UPI002FDD63FA